MSNEDKDKFVEDLIRGLPKAEPMSEFELRRFEKFIDQQAAALKASRTKRSFALPASIAAGITLLFAGTLVFSQLNGHAPIKTVKDQVITAPESAEPSTSSVAPSVSPTKKSSTSPQKSTSSGGSSSQETYGDQNQNTSENVPVFATGLDYSTQLSAAVRAVKLGVSGSSLKSLTNSARQCAIQLGLDSDLLAFDKAKYQGESIWAFHAGINPAAATISIVSTRCVLITELDSNP